VDATGNGFSMTTHASPTLSASGKVGTAVTWTAASSQYADLAHSATLNSASYSVSAWIKRAGTPTEEYILAHDGTATNQGWAFGIYQNKIMCLHQNVALVQSTSTITDTNWHHVGYTYDGTNAKFYLDGALDRTVAAGAFTAASATITIACNKSTAGAAKAFWNGTLDQVAYYPGVLSSGDFTTLYNSGSGKHINKIQFTGWRSITVDHTLCGSADSTNFPLMVSGTYSYLKTTGNSGDLTSSSGYDVKFYSDSALINELKYERVFWSGSTGYSEFVVKVPTLTYAADAVIYMAYGNSSITTDKSDPTNVYDANFLAVWHFGDGTTLGLNDSTSNGITLTNSSGTAAAGVAGGAVALNGTSQHLTGGTSSTLDLTGDLTFEALVKPTAFTNYNGILSRCNSNLPDPYDWYIIASGESGKAGKPRFFVGNGSVNTNFDGTTALTANAWNYTAVVMSGTTCTIDANGTSNSGTLSGSRTGHTRTLYVGNRADNATRFGGSIDEIRVSNTVRSTSWRTATYNNWTNTSTFYTISSNLNTTSYTLTAGQGSYTISGQSVALRAARKIAAAQGSYTTTGQSVNLRRGYTVVAAQGSYTLTGQSVALSAARKLTSAQGSYTISGQAVNLRLARTLTAGQGSLAISGQNVTLRRGYTISLGQGSYTITGQTVNLRRGYTLAVAQGSYSITGQAVALRAARQLAAGQGTYTITGYDVNFGATHSYTLTAGQGSYTITGQAVALRTARKITIGQGSYTTTGQAVNLRRGYTVAASQGSYAISGQTVGLRRGYTLTIAQGSYTVSGQAVSLRAARKLTVGQGTYTITGNAVNFGTTTSYTLIAAQGSYTLTGQAVALRVARQLVAAQGTYAVSGQSVNLRAARKITIAQGAYTISGQAVTLRAGRSLTAAQGTYSITGQAVALRAARQLAAGQGSYTITGQAVSIYTFLSTFHYPTRVVLRTDGRTMATLRTDGRTNTVLRTDGRTFTTIY